jgi:hypothetical protein
MPEDHIAILDLWRGTEKVGYHTKIVAIEGKKWCIKQGIWGVTDYPKEDGFER